MQFLVHLRLGKTQGQTPSQQHLYSFLLCPGQWCWQLPRATATCVCVCFSITTKSGLFPLLDPHDHLYFSAWQGGADPAMISPCPGS